MINDLSLDSGKNNFIPLKRENCVFDDYRGSYDTYDKFQLKNASIVGRGQQKGGGHPYQIPLFFNFLILLILITPIVKADIKIDPNEVWIKYGQEIIDSVDVLESNDGASVFVVKQEAGDVFDEGTETEVQETSGLTMVTSSATNDVTEETEILNKGLSGSHIVGIIGMIFAMLTVIIICFTIYKIKVK